MPPATISEAHQWEPDTTANASRLDRSQDDEYLKGTFIPQFSRQKPNTDYKTTVNNAGTFHDSNLLNINQGGNSTVNQGRIIVFDDMEGVKFDKDLDEEDIRRIEQFERDLENSEMNKRRTLASPVIHAFVDGITAIWKDGIMKADYEWFCKDFEKAMDDKLTSLGNKGKNRAMTFSDFFPTPVPVTVPTPVTNPVHKPAPPPPPPRDPDIVKVLNEAKSLKQLMPVLTEGEAVELAFKAEKRRIALETNNNKHKGYKGANTPPPKVNTSTKPKRSFASVTKTNNVPITSTIPPVPVHVQDDSTNKRNGRGNSQSSTSSGKSVGSNGRVEWQPSPGFSWAEVTKKKPKLRAMDKGTKSNQVVVRVDGQSAFQGINRPHGLALFDGVKECIMSLPEYDDFLLQNPLKNIAWSLRDDLILMFEHPVNDVIRKLVINGVASFASISLENLKILHRPVSSSVKFMGVPTYNSNGTKVSTDQLLYDLRRHAAWKNVEIIGDPMFIPARGQELGPNGLLLVNFKDTLKGEVLKRVLFSMVEFGGVKFKCMKWFPKNSIPQCGKCLRWGHTTFKCLSNVTNCPKCAKAHAATSHAHHCKDCDPSKRIICKTRRCINCDEAHTANSIDCVFFKARNNKTEMDLLLKDLRERNDKKRAERLSGGSTRVDEHANANAPALSRIRPGDKRRPILVASGSNAGPSVPKNAGVPRSSNPPPL